LEFFHTESHSEYATYPVTGSNLNSGVINYILQHPVVQKAVRSVLDKMDERENAAKKTEPKVERKQSLNDQWMKWVIERFDLLHGIDPNFGPVRSIYYRKRRMTSTEFAKIKMEQFAKIHLYHQDRAATIFNHG